jgi:hypothetical protein
VQTYPVRTNLRAGLTPAHLAELLTEIFGQCEIKAEEVVGRYGAIEELRVRRDNKGLQVEVRTNPKVDGETASDTIRRYNQFLEAATGYSAKERAKRLRKSAGGGE